ncbi:hypothetical protein KP509_23G086700 [Ceratopteris richardii]|nr:hypothetical protein KP509_23G086700 [Ceratopteris richardii]
MQRLSDLYKESDVSWFTPVELFKPWYGYALANYILKNYNSKFPLQIFEIGGGTGTCAKNILDYLKIQGPVVYDKMKYISIEISRALANAQLKTVHSERMHKSHFSVECRDACSQEGWGKVDENPCFVIMLEVLDNQPHDLIYKVNSSFPWLETRLLKRPESEVLVEIHKPVEDPWIQRCIKILEHEKPELTSWLASMKKFFHKGFRVSRKAWIPTGCMQLLEGLYTSHPNLSLIICDFNILPDVQVPGERAPLVAKKKDGVTVDLSSYLDVKGDADIFFPTDFQLLRQIDRHCYSSARANMQIHDDFSRAQRQSLIVPVSEFMKKYADFSKTQTMDGFNPLLDDYSNMQFFLSKYFYNS